MSRVICLFVAFAIVATSTAGRRTAGAQTAGIQSKKSLNSQSCVDAVRLKSGKIVRGAILRQEVNGSLTLAVQRAWLQKAVPDLFKQVSRDESAGQKQALEELRDRLKHELKRMSAGNRLETFLNRELKRVEKLLIGAAPPAAPQFVWFDATKNKIAKITPATTEARRMALWAWFEGLPNVEVSGSAVLGRELKQRGVDPVQPLPDLWERLPARLQDDREWGARMALVAYSLGEPLDFQGTGEMLVRSGRPADANSMAPVIAKLLSQQLDSLAKDLLGNGAASGPNNRPADEWLKPAVHTAESQQAKAFRATRVDFNLAASQVIVSSVFVVQLPNGNWEIIWSDREVEDVTKPRPALEATISVDPQLKSALETLRALGGVADDRLQQAVRCGGATMAAQKAVDSRFFAFQEPLLKRLDGPPLWWTK